MKILLTGATGYIGKRLLPVLIQDGHEVVCAVRDSSRFEPPESLKKHLTVIQLDLLKEETLSNIPKDIDAAYYLVHSMSSTREYESLEESCAVNFLKGVEGTRIKHVIYLTGIVNEEQLSPHLSSRKNVEDVLAGGDYHFTALRAGIIIGSGSASFEIIRDLVEKLPVMIAPKWLETKCQPIGIVDVLEFLRKSLMNAETFDRDFDIASENVLSYKEMLLEFAKVRKLKRWIFSVPVMTPRLSSYWLYFVTSTSFNLAQALVDSMKVDVVARDNQLAKLLDIQPMSYKRALERAFAKIEKNAIVSSWKDSMISGRLNLSISEFTQVPTYGCFIDHRKRTLYNREQTVDRIWSIGGETGWYSANFLWKLRGYLDKAIGGVGLRRGRTNPDKIQVGDALDFWRVLYANREEGRLLLFAEMKVPGDAWLEFHIKKDVLHQTATFRPKGVWGRIYWYAVLPFHGFVFRGMLRSLTRI